MREVELLKLHNEFCSLNGLKKSVWIFFKISVKSAHLKKCGSLEIQAGKGFDTYLADTE